MLEHRRDNELSFCFNLDRNLTVRKHRCTLVIGWLVQILKFLSIDFSSIVARELLGLYALLKSTQQKRHTGHLVGCRAW